MLCELNVASRHHPLRAPFRIARGAKRAADVIAVQLRDGDAIGRGEAVPYARYGESMVSVVAQVESVRAELAAGMDRDALQQRLPAGAARNALDTALWDLEARRTGVPVATRLGCPPRAPLATALTVSLDTPDRMGRAAAQMAGAGLIKVKVDATDPAARIAAVRHAAPTARLIVDANESWTIDDLRALEPTLEALHVDLLEQPLPADADEALVDFTGSVAICADEACHVTADLARLRGRYQAINIKLDKTGGLTEALQLLHAARAEGFRIMVGCMVCSSLGIAPALEVAREAEFVDLDGPWWLAEDHAGGARFEHGTLLPPAPGFWGD